MSSAVCSVPPDPSPTSGRTQAPRNETRSPRTRSAPSRRMRAVSRKRGPQRGRTVRHVLRGMPGRFVQRCSCRGRRPGLEPEAVRPGRCSNGYGVGRARDRRPAGCVRRATSNGCGDARRVGGCSPRSVAAGDVRGRTRLCHLLRISAGRTPRQSGAWSRQAVAHYRRDPGINRVEWKTRGHDHAPGLHDSLMSNGFTPDDPESIMIGEARALAVNVPAACRRATATGHPASPTCAPCAQWTGAIFDDPSSDEVVDALLRRLTVVDGMELWVAESQGGDHRRRTTGTGPWEPVRWSLGWCNQARMARPGNLSGTDGRAGQVGVAGRQDAHPLRLDRVLAPVLERSGLVRVSTTTPYRWRR